MPFLLLTQGDPIGLDLLKKLVDNRYGGNPPAMESLRVTYQGWSQAALGPVPLKANVEAVATYRFPFQFRWEFKVRMLRIFRSQFTTTFDGSTVYEVQRGRSVPITDPAQVESARARAWAEAVYFVSPLIADHDVHVQSIDTHAFRAVAPGFPDLAATVRLNEDNTLAAVEIERMDPGDNTRKLQQIVPDGGLKKVDGVLMPARMRRQWDGTLFMTLSPVKVELNPVLEEGVFRLEKEDLLAVLREESPDESAAPAGTESKES